MGLNLDQKAQLYVIANAAWEASDLPMVAVVDAVADAVYEHCMAVAIELHEEDMRATMDAATQACEEARLAGQVENNRRVVAYLRDVRAKLVGAKDPIFVVGGLADEIERFQHIPCTCNDCPEGAS